MDNKSSISSSKYICSTLDNISLNSNIFLTQVNEALNILNLSALSIVVPILKIKNKISMKLNELSRETREKQQDQEYNENTTHSDDSNIENPINPKNEKADDKIMLFCEQIQNNINLFTSLSNSEAYENIIKSFNELMPDNEMFIERDKKILNLSNNAMSSNLNNSTNKNNNYYDNSQGKLIQNEENDEEDEEGMNHKVNAIHKHIVKKKKKPLRKIHGGHQSTLQRNKEQINKLFNKDLNNLNINTNTNVNTNSSLKNIKEYSSSPPSITTIKKKIPTRKQQKEIDLLNMIQRDYPTNSYIQKASKSFLSRRLYKKVIYQHVFNYYENGYIDDKKVKTGGESGFYKNCKISFKFAGDKIQNVDKLEEFIGKEFRQAFIKLNEEENEYIIAGKIGCSIYELIEKIFKKNMLKHFSISSATLEFYEFYEELVNEFNEKEENVKIISCDEKTLKHIREDWKNLQICRDYVRQKKQQHAI